MASAVRISALVSVLTPSRALSMGRWEGFELSTKGLQNPRSTTELPPPQRQKASGSGLATGDCWPFFVSRYKYNKKRIAGQEEKACRYNLFVITL